jgi:hypothetical protein
MITFVSDVRPGETAFASAIFHEALHIADLDGHTIAIVQAPLNGWTHQKLVAIAEEMHVRTLEGADAKLGDIWVGSTEV